MDLYVEGSRVKKDRLNLLNKILSTLLIFKAIFWFGAGILFFVHQKGIALDQPIGIFIVTVLISGNSAVTLFIWWGVRRRARLIYYFSVIWVLLNIILAFTDQVGLIDLAVLTIDLAIFGLLVYTYKSLSKIQSKKEVKVNG